MFCVFLKEFNAVACIKSIFARLSSVGKKILFEKTVMSIFCSLCTGRNQGYIFAHDITDYVLYNRVVRTAEDERINAFCLYRCKVFFSSKSDAELSSMYPDADLGSLDYKWNIQEAGSYRITIDQLKETISIVKQ